MTVAEALAVTIATAVVVIDGETTLVVEIGAVASEAARVAAEKWTAEAQEGIEGLTAEVAAQHRMAIDDWLKR